MQESLQLDTMHGEIRQGNANILPLAPAPGFVIITEEIKVQVVKEVPYTVAKQVPIEIEKDGVKKTIVQTLWENQTKPLVETITGVSLLLSRSGRWCTPAPRECSARRPAHS